MNRVLPEKKIPDMGLGLNAPGKHFFMPDGLERAVALRRSCRKFSDAPISKRDVRTILTAGALAPSGKNGQPWKFIVIHNNKELLKQLSALTIYDRFVSQADCLIAVYLDKSQSYHYIKDVQAIGACIENMLLQAAALGVGNCWIGEILNRATKINALLGVGENLELMAILALGVSDDNTPQPKKKDLDDLILSFD